MLKLRSLFAKAAPPAPLYVPKAALLSAFFSEEELQGDFMDKHLAVTLEQNDLEGEVEQPRRVVVTCYDKGSAASGTRHYSALPRYGWPGTHQRDFVMEASFDKETGIYKFATSARLCASDYGPYETYRTSSITAEQHPEDPELLIITFATNCSEGVNPKKGEYIDPRENGAARARAAQIAESVCDNADFIKEYAEKVKTDPACAEAASHFPASRPQPPALPSTPGPQ